MNTWVGGGLPPVADGYLKGFVTHYMDPVEVRERTNALAAEFPDLAEIIDLPYATNGYQRKAMATMAGTTAIGSAPRAEYQSQAVVLFTKAWGHEGGNDVQAEFLDPWAANSPLTVSVAGSRITVRLATDSRYALVSTAAQVRDAINNDPAAGALVTAYTWAGDAGAGIVQPRYLVTLSDFLRAPSSVPRGPFQTQVLRIGKHRDGSKVGVFIFGQQHAREWTTPLVCIETAERLLRNYPIDPTTRSFVDNLDIFILPSSNPDGSLYSFYDDNMQRKNMTDYCPPTTVDGMPANRNSWGVDLNRNNTVGSVYDGYDGASTDPATAVYAGPSEASEPETKNELWVVDTYANIKFAVNVHSYGGYFMWSPGFLYPAGPRDAPGAEYRRRGLLLRRGGPDSQPDQGGASDGRVPGAHRPDHRCDVLGGGQQRGRSVVPSGDHLLCVRDGRRPVCLNAVGHTTDGGRLSARVRDGRSVRGAGVRVRQLRPAGNGSGVRL